eukprot:CCRYP_016898-RA/>CCRYP_016898-RA protein AED:0.26 eAED:0.23 QI:0/-1/0/1/-1/1/1/0/724
MASTVEKLVRFKETATIIITPGKPKEEIDSTWYSPNELWHFEQEAILDELLAARSKKLLLEMREELCFLRETWMEQLKSSKPHEDISDDESTASDNRTKPGVDPSVGGNTISSIDSKLFKHIVQAHESCLKETGSCGQPSSQLQQNSQRDQLTAAKSQDQVKEVEPPRSGLSRDPPSPSRKTGPRSPISVSQDVSNALPSSASKSVRSMVNDPQKLMPPPIFGPSPPKKHNGQESDKYVESKALPHPSTRTPKQNRTRSRRPPHPTAVTPLPTAKGWDSRRKSDNYSQSKRESTPGNNPIRAFSGKSLKQVPPPPPLPTKIITDRRNSDSNVKSEEGYGTNNAFKRSSTDPVAPMSSTTVTPTTASTSTVSQISEDSKRDHGWSVPIGVHKVICDSPGLLVTCDVHRRSAPVKRLVTGINNDRDCASIAAVKGDARSRRRQSMDMNLIIPPGTFIEVLETQVHGDRVRGRIVWDVKIETEEEENPKENRKRSSFMLSKLKAKKDKVSDKVPKVTSHRYTGWVSLQWASDMPESTKAGHVASDPKKKNGTSKNTAPNPPEEGAGPWTKPVNLGVYRVTCRDGLHVSESIERESALMGTVENGKYVEVVETRVHGDRVRARCIFAPSSSGEKPLHGWISLFNTVTGSSGASAVPLGAYVASSEANCLVTEGTSLYSKVQGKLPQGSCVEIVATRIEDGVIRGLISTGGHVTIITPDECYAPKGKQI